MLFGINACNKSNETEPESDLDLTATAWADNEGTLSIAFLINNGISLKRVR